LIAPFTSEVISGALVLFTSETEVSFGISFSFSTSTLGYDTASISCFLWARFLCFLVCFDVI